MSGLLDRLLRRRTHTITVPREVTERALDHMVEMEALLEELAELPGLEEFTRTRRVPPRFFELWDAALAAYDRYLAAMTGPGALPVRCKEGCSACCHEVPTGVQAVELLAIYAHYREFPDFVELHNRACDLADRLTTLLTEQAPGKTAIASDSPEAARALLEYRSERRPCVFLEPDTQRCRIYERRPIPCRMHFSLSDPAWCSAGHPEAEQAVTPNLEPHRDMLAHMKTIARRLGLEQLPPTLFQGLGLLGGQVMKTESLAKPGDASVTKTRNEPRNGPRRGKARGGKPPGGRTPGGQPPGGKPPGGRHPRG